MGVCFAVPTELQNQNWLFDLEKKIVFVAHWFLLSALMVFVLSVNPGLESNHMVVG
jgi:hypothetical protein